jgi:arginine-tRNA-protein transferase
MVYYDIHYPENLSGSQLDEYLADGWYRMQQTIFTTDVILKDNKLSPVFWLRLSLDKYTASKKNNKLINNNKSYNVECAKAVITEELEELYQLYKSSVNFELSESIQDCLLGESITGIYNTHCFTIREGEKLIAAGFFDEGNNSMAGILNIYHPQYASKGLGKYLMLLKIEYARQHHKQFYYTGYISTTDPKFDYKLFAGKEATEVYNRSEEQWVPWLSVQKEVLHEWLLWNDDSVKNILLPGDLFE